MEALNATQVALLTVYDMCKAVDRGMIIESVRLVEKRGGKSGDWVRSGGAEALTPTAGTARACGRGPASRPLR